MLVQGRLVIVDAPCSGVQMAWMAWFCACAVAALAGCAIGVFLRRLPWVGAIVLAGQRAAQQPAGRARSAPAGFSRFDARRHRADRAGAGVLRRGGR